jgi:hypothetical protein
MSEPKVTYDLRQVIFDSNIALAETNDILAAEDIDDMTNYAHADEDGGAVLTNAAGGGTTGLTVIAARIEHPRNVVLTFVIDGATAGNVRVVGIGMSGLPTSELFTLPAASGARTGNVPFLRVDEVHVWGVTGTLTANDHMSIGIGAKIGLPMGNNCILHDVVKERFNLADVAVTPANINRTYGTYTPTSTLDAAKVLELWYTVKRVFPW